MFRTWVAGVIDGREIRSVRPALQSSRLLSASRTTGLSPARQRNGANRGSAGKSRYRPSREPRARCDFKANAGSGEAVNIWNQIQAVMSGRRIIVSTRRLPLLELELGSQRAEAFRNCTMLAPAWTAFRVRQEPAGRLNQRACPDARLEAIVSADRIVSWAAAENARERMRTVATRPVMPEAARIIATMMNW